MACNQLSNGNEVSREAYLKRKCDEFELEEEVTDSKRTSSQNKSQREISMEKGTRLLALYKDKNGHCNVPPGVVLNQFPLGEWVKEVRKNVNDLSSSEYESLDGLGFVWCIREHTWNQNFRTLEKSKALHGQVRVPWGFKDPATGLLLGRWVHRQRKANSNDDGRGRCILTQEHKHNLDDIGFTWDTELRERWRSSILCGAHLE